MKRPLPQKIIKSRIIASFSPTRLLCSFLKLNILQPQCQSLLELCHSLTLCPMSICSQGGQISYLCRSVTCQVMKWERTWKGNEETLRRRVEGDKSKKRLVPGLISPLPWTPLSLSHAPLTTSQLRLHLTLERLHTARKQLNMTGPPCHRAVCSPLNWCPQTSSVRLQCCLPPRSTPYPRRYFMSPLCSHLLTLSSSSLSADDLASNFRKKKETIRRNSTSSHHAICPPTSICTHRLWLLSVNCGWRVSAPKDNPPPTLGS